MLPTGAKKYLKSKFFFPGSTIVFKKLKICNHWTHDRQKKRRQSKRFVASPLNFCPKMVPFRALTHKLKFLRPKYLFCNRRIYWKLVREPCIRRCRKMYFFYFRNRRSTNRNRIILCSFLRPVKDFRAIFFNLLFIYLYIYILVIPLCRGAKYLVRADIPRPSRFDKNT